MSSATGRMDDLLRCLSQATAIAALLRSQRDARKDQINAAWNIEDLLESAKNHAGAIWTARMSAGAD